MSICGTCPSFTHSHKKALKMGIASQREASGGTVCCFWALLGLYFLEALRVPVIKVSHVRSLWCPPLHFLPEKEYLQSILGQVASASQDGPTRKTALSPGQGRARQGRASKVNQKETKCLESRVKRLSEAEGNELSKFYPKANSFLSQCKLVVDEVSLSAVTFS